MNNKWLQAGVAALAITSVIAATSPTFAQGKEARVRIVHASPDAPKVDVFVNGKLAFKDVFFKEITPYETFQPGDVQIQVVPHGKTVKEGPVVLDTKTKLEAGKDYSIIASGMLSKIAPVVLTDTPSAGKKGDAWVRLVNVSTAMPELDMTAMPNKGKAMPLSKAIAFKAASDYMAVPAGEYKFDIKPAGADESQFQVRAHQLRDGDAYTIFAFDQSKPELAAEVSLDAIKNSK